jgi:F0F1-type ATP synthase delta subunit
MNFENEVKTWINIDNQLREINEQTKKLREKRNVIENNLTNYINTNNLTGQIIKYGDTKLRLSNTKVTETITLKYLEKTLGEIIKNEEQVKNIMNYIRTNREIKIVPEIKRLSNN